MNNEERENDFLSHYFVRLGYCRTKDLRDWFVRQETLLFKARLSDSFTLIGNSALKNELQRASITYKEYFPAFQIVDIPILPSHDDKKIGLAADQLEYIRGKYDVVNSKQTHESFIKVLKNFCRNLKCLYRFRSFTSRSSSQRKLSFVIMDLPLYI